MSFNYIGSKKSLLKFIQIPLEKIIETYENKEIKFLDGFSGTGIISVYFKSLFPNIKIISNDMEYYSYIINYSQLCVSYNDNLKKIIENMEYKQNIFHDYNLISTNYSPKGIQNRMFWTEENAVKADYIRYIFDDYLQKNIINNDEHIFLISSLLLSLDKVANTTSVYGSFLKQFKKSSQQKLILKPIHTNILNKISTVHNEDINSNIILNQKYDIVYLDPPYNQRQYCSNYHPLNYIAKYDNNLEIYGKTGLLKDIKKSKYCRKNEAYDTLKHLLLNLKTKHILLSYNNEGLIKFDDIKELVTSLGKVILYTTPHKKYKSNLKQKNENVLEYLFHLEKSNVYSFTIIEI